MDETQLTEPVNGWRTPFEKPAFPLDRWDWIISLIVCACFAGLLWSYRYAEMPSLRGGVGVGGAVDEGTVVYTAKAMAKGHIPYLDIWTFKGPVGYLPFVAAFKFLPATVATARSVMILVVSLWSAICFLAARVISGERWVACCFAVIVAFVFWPNWHWAYEDFSAQLWLTTALLCSLLAWQRPWLWTAVGVCCALALWTSLAQGVAGAFPLLLSAPLLALVCHDARLAKLIVAREVSGLLAVSLSIVIWFALLGCLQEALAAIFVFPFTNYSADPYNRTEFAFDRSVYVAAWSQESWLLGLVVRLLSGITVYLPGLGLTAACIVGAALIQPLFSLLRSDAETSQVSDRRLPPYLTLPAAIAPTFLPVLLGVTRSDMCHIGFVAGTASLVLFSYPRLLKGYTSGSGYKKIVATILKISLTAAMSLIAIVALGFHVFLLRQVKNPKPIDTAIAQFSGADLIKARTRPEDRIVVLTWGGYSYLTSDRDSGIAFPFLFPGDGPYSRGQWNLAASQIVKNDPQYLFISGEDFATLVSHEPTIQAMYFGYPGNYMRARRRHGPMPCLPSRWTISGPDWVANSIIVIRGSVDSSLLVRLEGFAWWSQGHLDGDQFSIFEGATALVGHLNGDATEVRGRVFVGGADRGSFRAARIECPDAAKELRSP